MRFLADLDDASPNLKDALHSICDSMDDLEIQRVISAIENLSIDDLETIVVQSHRLIGKGMRSADRIEIVKMLLKYPIYRIPTTVTQALPLIDETTSLPEIEASLKLCSKLDFKLEAVIKESARLFSKSMTFSDKWMIVTTLRTFEQARIHDLVKKSLPLIKDSMDAEGRLEVVNSILLPDFLKVEAPAFEKIVQKMKLMQAGKIIERVHHIPPNIRSHLLRQLCDLISDKMDGDSVVTIIDALENQDVQFPLVNHSQLRLNPPRFSPNPLLTDLPFPLQWRLGIDRYFHSFGPHYFDQDLSKNYLSGMLKCWRFLDQIRDRKIDACLLRMIHDVFVNRGSFQSAPLEKGYASSWSFAMDPRWFNQNRQELFGEWEKEKLILTPEKVKESINEYVRNNPSSSQQQIDKFVDSLEEEYLSALEYTKPRWTVFNLANHNLENKVNEILDRFYKEAQQAVTLDQKYAAVARCCRALLVFHPFPDGNGRTICFALLNVLLNQIGSSLAMVATPYFFNGTRTIAELVEAIREGVEAYQQIKMGANIEKFLKDSDDKTHLKSIYKNLRDYVAERYPNVEKLAQLYFDTF